MNRKKIIIISIAVVIIGIITYFVARSFREQDTRAHHRSGSDSFLSSTDDDAVEHGIDDPQVEVINLEHVRMIEDVVIDKNPVCSGEDFQVTVKASPHQGSSSHLTYRVSNFNGNPAILNFKSAGKKQIHVFVNDHAIYNDFKTVTVNVVDCPEKPTVQLRPGFSKKMPHEVDFEAINIKGMNGNCIYDWNFGDGKTAKTNVGFTSHNYGDREQKSYTSTFIASVKVTDASGTSVTARTALTFPNIQWLSSQMGTVTLPAVYDRFPNQDGNTYNVKIKIKNIFDRDVSFNDAEVTFVPCSSSDKETSRTFAASFFISKSYLAPEEMIDDTLSFQKSVFPYSTCTMKILLKGTIGLDKPVSSPVFLTIPLSREDARDAVKKNQAHVVTDQAIIDKFQKAKAILGKDIITPADIEQLEKEGKL